MNPCIEDEIKVMELKFAVWGKITQENGSVSEQVEKNELLKYLKKVAGIVKNNDFLPLE